ncbi:MAG: hypothetical protein HYY06_06940 [Deltaproteobacteria bacterium]|nr:hypothetical protein [Deltaproteobacteria bacterium]
MCFRLMLLLPFLPVVGGCGAARAVGDDPDAGADADADVDADTDADADADTDADADSDADADADADGDSDGDGDGDGELCNGADDDGDGEIDEGSPEEGFFCETGLVGSCALGHTVCVGGALDCDPDIEPEDEDCANPGIDDDCNGVTDDVPEVGGECDTGLDGICAEGELACEDPELVCIAVRASTQEICSNGSDEDCNGEVDEEGCIDRTQVMLCGVSGRPVSNFIPDDRPDLVVVNGCDPDETTQAFFVTRNGVGNVNGQTLRDYLDAGGNVITEYSTTPTLFNAAFEEAVVQGRGYGGCMDNVNPVVQLSPDDRFWQDNEFSAEDQSGCGMDMSVYPDITPLGGWDAFSVSLAYRDRGAGRLWLVEADWQDNENYFSEESTSLMRYMVGWLP